MSQGLRSPVTRRAPGRPGWRPEVGAWGRSWKGPPGPRAADAVGVSEAHTCPLTILQPSGHAGRVGLGCPVAVAGWLPEPFLGQPFFGVWVPLLSGVGALPPRGEPPSLPGDPK